MPAFLDRCGVTPELVIPCCLHQDNALAEFVVGANLNPVASRLELQQWSWLADEMAAFQDLHSNRTSPKLLVMVASNSLLILCISLAIFKIADLR